MKLTFLPLACLLTTALGFPTLAADRPQSLCIAHTNGTISVSTAEAHLIQLEPTDKGFEGVASIPLSKTFSKPQFQLYSPDQKTRYYATATSIVNLTLDTPQGIGTYAYGVATAAMNVPAGNTDYRFTVDWDAMTITISDPTIAKPDPEEPEEPEEPQIGSVSLAGDFSGWQKQPFTWNEAEEGWELEVPALQGNFRLWVDDDVYGVASTAWTTVIYSGTSLAMQKGSDLQASLAFEKAQDVKFTYWPDVQMLRAVYTEAKEVEESKVYLIGDFNGNTLSDDWRFAPDAESGLLTLSLSAFPGEFQVNSKSVTYGCAESGLTMTSGSALQLAESGHPLLLPEHCSDILLCWNDETKSLTATYSEPVEDPENTVVAVANTDYELTGADAVFKFVSENGGKVSFSPSNAFKVCTDANGDHVLETEFQGYVNGGQAYLIAEPGQTLYFFQLNNWYNSFPFRISIDMPVLLEKASPAAGTELSIVARPQLDLWFNQPVKVGTAVMTINGTSHTLQSKPGYTISPSFEIAEILKPLYGVSAQEGDQVVFRFTDIATEEGTRYEENGGVIELTYTLACAPLARTQFQELPGDFLSWWDEGDATARIQYGFNQEPSRVYAVLAIGDPMADSENDYYVETVEGTINGKRATIDFAGKSRRYDDMFGAEKPYNTINIKVYALDKSGYPAISDEPGAFGSFTHNYSYVQLPEAPATTEDFNVSPEEGNVLKLSTFEISSAIGQAIIVDETKMPVLRNAEDLEIALKATVAEGESVKLEVVDELTGNGSYTLTIPEGFVKFVGTEGSFVNAARTLVYLLTNSESGIENMGSDETADVISLQGHLVLKGASKEDLRKLAPGLYIVAGRKVRL